MDSSDFVGIFEVYEKHAVYFPIQRKTMLFYGIATNVVILFALYVMKTASIELLGTFRVLMYCNVVFPALECNMICFLFVPHIMVPYPVILSMGPTRLLGRETTLLYSVLFWWFGAGAVVSIADSVSLHYISLFVVTPFSMTFIYLIISDTQSVSSMLTADPRNAVFVNEFAAMPVYLFQSFGVDLGLIALLLIYTGAAIVGSAMIIRVILRIRSRKHEFSPKTYRLHINVVIALVMYCVILFLQVGLPIMLFVITVVFSLSWMTA
ncbi:7TM chemoreceptor, partial [Ostertagia ostertagi]